MIRIGQLTDIHVADLSDLRRRDFLTKRATGWVNLRMHRNEDHHIGVLRAAIDRMVHERPDLVLVTGDLSNLGLRSEWLAARALLSPLEDAGIRVGVIPGNHDYYVPSSSRGAFEQVFAMQQWADARLDAPYPFVLRAGHVSVLMVNSALPTAPLMAWGRVDWRQLDRIAQLADIERDQGRQLMLALHHHPVRAPHKRVEITRNLRHARALRDVCRRHGIGLVVHGHNHLFHPVRLSSADGPVVVGVASSSSRRQDDPRRRGQVALYTFDGQGLHSLQTAEWSPLHQAFSLWHPTDLDALPVEYGHEVAILDPPPTDTPA
jgi:3',5'-cyclic AMP phosphodiesterase CpdA